MKIEEKEELLALDIKGKIAVSKSVIREAVERYGGDRLALAITGGKDSTTALWIARSACEEMGARLPVCIFIDEGDVFDEIRRFVGHIGKLWSLDIAFLKNEDVSSKAAGGIGAPVSAASLNDANRAALHEMGFAGEEFPFVPDSPLCNHLMKTLPMREFIAKNALQAVSVAIRWDEQAARTGEEYFAERENPPHTRIHPILHFRERDIWAAIFEYEIPFNDLYKLGYRSLGARCATGKNTDTPAWLQDFEATPERVGRGGDKEKVMGRLRALGYM